MNIELNKTAISTNQTRFKSIDLLARKLWTFGLRQAWSAMFGGIMLGGIILTKYVELPYLSRYDWMFLLAVITQVCMLVFRLERLHEAATIVLFHLVGLGMELFKTSSSVGSWAYPEDSIIRLGNVPLFSGFMYAAVGSYIARSWRVMKLSFSGYPSRPLTVLLAVAIYTNFFTHHYIWDMRYLLFALTFWLYRKTKVSYVLNQATHSMPLLVGFLLITFFIWIAENIGTYTTAWLYPEQVGGWKLVSAQKIGSWLLLMIISFIMVEIMLYFRSRVVLRSE